MDHIAPGGLPLDHVGVGTVSPSRRQFLQTTLAVAAAGALPGVAVGQAYPAKPIRLILRETVWVSRQAGRKGARTDD